MSILKNIPFEIYLHLYWLFYVVNTQKERLCFRQGKLKGYMCTGYKKHLNGFTFYYDVNRAPMRTYQTYSEFMEEERGALK